ncbi:MAG: hypothetical protein H6Q04_3499, partial [Acidobacteria bacterium]|nr:hypothetical protein [Acidobacteriota bacterium]
MTIIALLVILPGTAQPIMNGFVNMLGSNLKHGVAWAIMNQAKYRFR